MRTSRPHTGCTHTAAGLEDTQGEVTSGETWPAGLQIQDVTACQNKTLGEKKVSHAGQKPITRARIAPVRVIHHAKRQLNRHCVGKPKPSPGGMTGCFKRFEIATIGHCLSIGAGDHVLPTRQA